MPVGPIIHHGSTACAGRRGKLLADLLALTPLARPQVGSPSWTNRFSSPGMADDVARAVAVDGSGNVFVAGYSYGGGGGGNFDYAILAYSSLGMPLWTNRYNA